MGIALTLLINLKHISILILLNLLIHECGLYIDLLKLVSAMFYHFLCNPA
jgi:hypothetical protein